MNKFAICLMLLLLMFSGLYVPAQSKIEKKGTEIKKEEKIHSPHKATIYSAILPGLGQIYNKKYWKVPLVYGGFAAFGYFINLNNKYYVKYRQAYSDIIDDDPNTTSYLNLELNPNYNLNDPDHVKILTEGIQNGKDYWRRSRDLVIICTAAFYALNVIDASVDANFFDFDMSDDLSINWAPGPVICMDGNGFGINCIITF